MGFREKETLVFEGQVRRENDCPSTNTAAVHLNGARSAVSHISHACLFEDEAPVARDLLH
jgi:hypothetical protein